MYLMLLKRPLVAAVFLLLSLPIVAAKSPRHPKPAMLDCHLIAPLPTSEGQPIMLGFTLANHGSKPLWVLDWNTPLEGIRNAYLQINGATGDVPYEGPMIKRAAPGPNHYQSIAPGQALRAEVDISKVYRLAAGQYQVRYVGNLLDVRTSPPSTAGSAMQPKPLVCKAVSLTVLAP